MGEKTKIEWADHTFNPWIGCTRISPACDHCYAETLAKRYGWVEWGPGKPRKRTSPANWQKPIAWDRAAKAAGVRRRVFCASLADIFDAEVPERWREELFADVVMATPQLDWLLLTKRPQVAAKWFAEHPAPPNVWLGTTVEDQKMADLRIPILLSIPVGVRFLSCEPLLGPIEIRDHLEGHEEHGIDMSREVGSRVGACVGVGPSLDWVIAGGESGPHARPSHPDWLRSLRDQCAAAVIPFFFKQWGEWAPVPGSPRMVRQGDCFLVNDGRREILGAALSSELEDVATPMRRLGKRAAGVLLDGREHHAKPLCGE